MIGLRIVTVTTVEVVAPVAPLDDAALVHIVAPAVPAPTLVEGVPQ